MVTNLRRYPGPNRVAQIARCVSTTAHSRRGAPSPTAPTEDHAATLDELRATQHALENAQRGRQAIQELSAALLSLTDVDALSNRLLEDLSTLVRADNGSVMLLSESGDDLEIAADVGLPSDARRTVQIGEGIAGTVVQRGEPALLLGAVKHAGTPQREVQSALVIPIMCRGESLGVVNLNRRPGAPPFSASELELVATVVATFSAVFDAVRQQERSRAQMLSTIRALAQAIEAKDPFTRGHCDRVARYCRGVAEAVDLPPQLVDQIDMGATLHDVGKIGVPEEILLKPGPLDEDERAIIQRHPQVGADIIRPVSPSSATLDAVRFHHERLDGNGYPHGLSGDEIPLAARILAVVDAFDAMTMSRPYRGARTFLAAYDELQRCAGTQFDPAVVSAFLAYCKREQIHQRLAHVGPTRSADADTLSMRVPQRYRRELSSR